MQEITRSHTGSHLKSVIDNVMNRYGLTLDNIFSVTTDNGANFVKCVSLIRDELESQNEDAYGINEIIDQVVTGDD